MDVINLISKAPGLPDADVVNPSTAFQPGYAHFVNGLVFLNFIVAVY
jgi:oligo-1,6-glucosidase